jgi:hypothetical protein
MVTETAVVNKQKISANASSKKYQKSDKGKANAHRFYIKNKERIDKRTYNNLLKRTYGITIEDYNFLFNLQSGCCAICGKHQSAEKKRLHVDHDHATGKIRGLLCVNCNSMLGQAKDSINILQNSIEYLKRHNDTQPHHIL